MQRTHSEQEKRSDVTVADLLEQLSKQIQEGGLPSLVKYEHQCLTMDDSSNPVCVLSRDIRGAVLNTTSSTKDHARRLFVEDQDLIDAEVDFSRSIPLLEKTVVELRSRIDELDITKLPTFDEETVQQKWQEILRGEE